MPTYEITIPERGTFRVTSETELSDQQAYEAALAQSAPQESPAMSMADVPGLTARSGIQGVAAFPNLIADPFVALANRAGANLPLPSQALSRTLTQAGLPDYPATTMGRIQSAATEALTGGASQIAAARKLAEEAISPVTQLVSRQFAAQPTAQLAAAPPAAAVSQATLEATGSPLAALVAAGATGAATGARTRPQPKIAEELKKEATQAYKLAEKAGLVVQPGYVKNIADRVSKVAFDEGYDPGLHPQISAVLKRLSDEGASPKTLEELERLRRIVRAPGQTFDNPDQQRIAGNMIDEFDDLIESVGTQNINVTGSKDVALSALTRARDTYKKSRKVSIIEDMIENATTRASQQTQAGLDNTLRNQFVNLSTNKKRMASFNKAERDEITRIARGGGNIQQMLRFTGRFAIRGPVTGIFAGGAATIEPTIGIPLALAAEGGKRGAEALRQRDVSRLIEQIAGRQVSQPSLVPITAARGLLSSQQE
jgi:hypothetical protein